MLTTMILCLMTSADVAAKMQEHHGSRWPSAARLLCRDRMMFAVSLLVVVA